jgi:hypothetical protein
MIIIPSSIPHAETTFRGSLINSNMNEFPESLCIKACQKVVNHRLSLWQKETIKSNLLSGKQYKILRND